MSSDATIVAALRLGEAGAWSSFIARFQPVLHAQARRVGIPRWDCRTCITDLLVDEALRLSTTAAPPPRHVRAYLVRALCHRHLWLKRRADCRERHHMAASSDRFGERVVLSTCSQHALRLSAGPDAVEGDPPHVLLRLAHELESRLTTEKRLILAWVGEGVPRPVIAEWLGISPAACAKRVWRLCRRLRIVAAERATTFPPSDRQQVCRFLHRAGHASDISSRGSRRVARTNAGVARTARISREVAVAQPQATTRLQ